MRNSLRAAVLLPLLFLLSTLTLAQTALSASTAATTPDTLTAGSFVRATLAPGPNSINIDVAGTYSGQLALQVAYQGATGPLRTLPASTISNTLTQGGTGISASATGCWSATVNGPGYVYVVATSLVSGQPSVVLSAGQGPSVSGAATSANQTINLNPLGTALYAIGATDVTVLVEYRDTSGTVIPLVDTNGTSYSAITVTVPAGTARGLSYLVLNTSPDTTHPIAALPTGAAGVVMFVASGTSGTPTLAINSGGRTDGAAGTATNGCNTGYGPNSSSPYRLYIGDLTSIGRIR